LHRETHGLPAAMSSSGRAAPHDKRGNPAGSKIAARCGGQSDAEPRHVAVCSGRQLICCWSGIEPPDTRRSHGRSEGGTTSLRSGAGDCAVSARRSRDGCSGWRRGRNENRCCVRTTGSVSRTRLQPRPQPGLKSRLLTAVEAEVGVAAGIGAGVVSGAGDVDSSSGVGTLELELKLRSLLPVSAGLLWSMNSPTVRSG